MPNETREQALKDVDTELERLPVRDLALMTGEALFVRSLAEAAGCTVDEWGRRAWSSELTEARAAALVAAARQTVLERMMEAERKKQERRRAGRGRRR